MPYAEALIALNADLIALEAKVVQLREVHADNAQFASIMDAMKAAIDSLEVCAQQLDQARNQQ